MPFLIEFIVPGNPVSLQTRNKAAKAAWMTAVSTASEVAYPPGSPLFPDPVRAAIYNFPAAAMPGDVDNIVKPILDALCQRVYVDDHQVSTVVVSEATTLRELISRRNRLIHGDLKTEVRRKHVAEMLDIVHRLNDSRF